MLKLFAKWSILVLTKYNEIHRRKFIGKEKKDSSMVSHKRIGIRFKVIVPVAIMNIIIGVVLTTFVLNALKTQCVYSGA